MPQTVDILKNSSFESKMDSLIDAVEGDYVKYAQQTLTEPQKIQARENIGAGSSAYDSTPTAGSTVPATSGGTKTYVDTTVANRTAKKWNNGNTLTFTTAGWVKNGSWYTQTLSVTGMTSDCYPTMIPYTANPSNVYDVQLALAKIAYITTGTNSITAYATQALTTPIVFYLVNA